MDWRIHITEPGCDPREHRLAEGETLVVGRAPDSTEPSLVLRDLYASKRHACLTARSAGVEVGDLDSSNGVLLNGFRLATGAIARSGDVVGVGRTSLRFEGLPAAAVAAIPGLEIPARLLERFTPLVRVSENETGTVLQAQRSDGRLVALKIVSGDASLAGQHLAREIRLLRRLKHPHVVQLLEGGVADGQAWLATEWIEGRTLAAHIAAAGRLQEADVVSIGHQLLEALSAAHALGVVHRDVKPANVLLDGTKPWPFAVLVDFGLAAPTSNDTPSRFTTTGSAKGTPRYMAPEQLQDAKRAGPAADQYGVAATLYEALTGSWHLAESGRGLWVDLLDAQPVPLTQRGVGATPRVVAAVERALKRHPDQRYSCVDAMRRALCP